jgi:hypothetical protein
MVASAYPANALYGKRSSGGLMASQNASTVLTYGGLSDQDLSVRCLEISQSVFCGLVLSIADVVQRRIPNDRYLEGYSYW